MRIEPTNTFTPPPALAPEGGSKVAAGKASGSGVSGTAAAGGFSPTSDLARLVALVAEVPEVRAEVVQDLLDRASTGELATRQAATDTAAVMLDGQ